MMMTITAKQGQQMKDLNLELPVVDTSTPQAPPIPSRYMVVVDMVDANDDRLKGIPHNPTDDEIKEAIRKYEEDHEWTNRVWEAYIDEHRQPKD